MTLDDVMTVAIRPALSLLPQKMDTPEAVRMLLAIGLQESLFSNRKQIRGPAHGFWQFEPSGVEGVMWHHSSQEYAQGLCQILNYPFDEQTVYEAVRHNDVLAAGFARLLLWRLPDPLPTIAPEAWAQYIEAWRPGKPRRALWSDNWTKAGDVKS